MHRLSKSQFMRGLQCHKSLWLLKFKPELQEEPSLEQQAIFDTGIEVGILAQQLFPNGEKIKFDYNKINENIQKTKALIKQGIKTIYEATFLFDDVLVIVDILQRNKNKWEIYEVKSSTDVKPEHEDDVSIQYYVLNGSGLNITKVSIVHINNQYIRKGKLDIEELFSIVDITDSVISKQGSIPNKLMEMRNTLEEKMPDVDIGVHCFNPYNCDFISYCWNHVPEISVFNLTRMKQEKKFELYYEGILKYKDIPKDYSLTEAQIMQIESELKNKVYMNKDKIKEFFNEISEPTGFFDFETFQEAIPSFDNQRPFQQIPFQYSLHILEKGKLSHNEFLAEAGNDPRKELITRLMEDTIKCKTIIVYNKSFEERILRELAELFPFLNREIENISKKMVDLMKVFQNKYYYVKKMKGSYSIKNVLPALVPELTYDDLEISDGGMAMLVFAQLKNIDNKKEIKRIKNNLLEYCKMDTLAMVRILEKLRKTIT